MCVQGIKYESTIWYVYIMEVYSLHIMIHMLNIIYTLHIVLVICILLVFGHWVCCAYMLTIWPNVSIITGLNLNKYC